MQHDFSVVCQDRFIEATRDSGYKGTESALSELIDNSIQAGATRVAIRMIAVEEEYSGKGKPKLPRVVEVAIGDNGRGMDADVLRRALRFGDSIRFNDRSGLGRFGMGLPNASVSQCKRVEVYSWQKGQPALWTYLDVREVADGTMAEIPVPKTVPIPAPLRELADGQSGTIVVWRECDRLDHDGKLDALERFLKHGLGRIFRYFLIADFELTLNGNPIEPFDPLYLMPQARLPDDLLAARYGDDLKFAIPIPATPDQTSTVEVTLCLLPEEWQLNFNKNRHELKRRHLEERRVFSIVRARREIDLIRDPYRAAHWLTDRWYRVEIRFEPELDEVFGVTHTKQHAQIRTGTPIHDRLREAIHINVRTMIDTILARAKKAHVAQTVRAEEAAQSVVARLKPLQELTQKGNSKVADEVSKFLAQRGFEKSPEERQRLEERLSKYSIIMEYEPLPGAPFYRTKVVGRSIVLLLNTEHSFYDRVYRRIEGESPHGKTGIDLLLMALARSEVLAGEVVRIWYDDQRHEWSQHLRAYVEQLDEPEDGEAMRVANGDLQDAPVGLV